tara:strand:- start:65871 stop:66455 length:585 start_codon:yes stop_codon:yes gene_type:complete
MHIAGRWSRQFQIKIVIMARGIWPVGMTRRDNRVAIEVYAADKSDLTIPPCIDDPAFLVMAMVGRGTVPANGELCIAEAEHLALIGAACEHVIHEMGSLVCVPPENDAHIKPAPRRTIQNVEKTATSVRHLEILRDPRNGQIDGMCGRIDRLADSAKSGETINMRTKQIAAALRVRAGSDRRDMGRRGDGNKLI